MKWVTSSHGKVPEGYTPVQGGYEVGGEQLYHAVAKINGVWCPGKTGVHLEGANFPWHNGETRLVSSLRHAFYTMLTQIVVWLCVEGRLPHLMLAAQSYQGSLSPNSIYAHID
jgi:hypothetical protein